MSSTSFIVRAAPSPTGTLHIGNCKMFIFNYIFAKKTNSNFLLRIEDTDKAREVENGAENILHDLHWLGLKPTMGYGTNHQPAKYYKQSERLPIYQEWAEKLLAEGKAYKCYCSQEELDKKREEALAKDPKNPFKYPSTCADLKEAPADKKDYIIRLKTPKDGFTEVNDIAFGNRQMPNKENYDFAIMRSNGMPLFGFANVIDDGVIDKVSHVIRGADHYANTLQHVLIYQAIGVKPPIFCHLGLLRNKSNAKLSKRDGSVSVAEYRNMGYSPNAIINYLVRFGWGSGNKEIFSLEELINLFDLNDCHCRDGKFDPAKFAVINYEHLKSETLTPDNVYAALLKPFIDAKNIGNITEEQLIPYIKIVRPRSRTFVEAANYIEPMLKELQPDTDLFGKTFNEHSATHLKAINAILCNIENWNEDVLRKDIQSWLAKENLTLKEIGAPLRIALLGTNVSPELFSVMGVMGKAKSLGRINNTLTLINK